MSALCGHGFTFEDTSWFHLVIKHFIYEALQFSIDRAEVSAQTRSLIFWNSVLDSYLILYCESLIALNLWEKKSGTFNIFELVEHKA